MHADTLLRKLHLQQALSDDELKGYLEKLGPDGSLQRSEIPALLELMMQRTEKLSIDDIKAVSSLACGDQACVEQSGNGAEDQAMRTIISKLSK